MLCAIIGGGPAGMSAALLLARARHRVLLFDDAAPRNRVTSEMHGYLTREGVSPQKFRSMAKEELANFSNIKLINTKVISVSKLNDKYVQIYTEKNKEHIVDRVILAMGIKETLPDIPNIASFYGKSLFSCPYCDGYEVRDQPLAVIAEGHHGLTFAATIKQWSSKLVWFTNGKYMLTENDKNWLAALNIRYVEDPISNLTGRLGKLEYIELQSGQRIRCKAGFVSPYWSHVTRIAEQLGCRMNESGGIWQDGQGRTSVSGVYVAGDVTNISPAQASIAAADGVKCAISLNQDMTKAIFMRR